MAVQFGPSEPRIRASLRVTCEKEIITTFNVRMAIDHKDGLFADWYEVDYEYHHDLPGLGRSYPLIAKPCRDGSYRARASIIGTFTNGEVFKLTEETSSTSINCEKTEPIT
ncbi:hypothetical protein [Nonomuraea monospora]|uniref:hypothetical protein n=1 Tax=Nonomuraea monospora TaxID=568818 RepID=UPI0031E33AF2